MFITDNLHKHGGPWLEIFGLGPALSDIYVTDASDFVLRKYLVALSFFFIFSRLIEIITVVDFICSLYKKWQMVISARNNKLLCKYTSI